MNENKRKLSCENSSEEKSKKFSNLRISSFEDLSNEILCEIFDYFNGDKLIKSFSNLNIRFEELLHSSFVLLKTHFYLFENDKRMNKFKDYMLTNHHQIFSITITFFFDKSSFFSSFLFDSSFDHLESIVFENIQSDTIIPVLNNLFYLPTLFSLTIQKSTIKEEIHEIYRLIFLLPKLKYSRISLVNSFYSITFSMIEFSSIECLVLDHFCSLNQLQFLISFTPKLRRLTARKIKTNNSNIEILSIQLDYLKSVYLNLYQTTFDQLERFCQKFFSNLNLLTIITSDDITYLDAYRWEQFILDSFPQLEKFYFFYNEQTNSPIIPGKQNQFSSSFWIQRKWLFEVEIKYNNIQYAIRPFSPRWYHYPEYKIEHSTMNCLTIESISPYICKERIFEQFQRVLRITQIYYLEILQDDISISFLIQAIHLLPDLIILKIHSLSDDETSELTVNEIFMLCSMKDTSQITKVYFEEIYNMKELDFIFTLCPYIKYFRIKNLNVINVQAVLQLFFKNINRMNNHHLRALCFRLTKPDDLIIQNTINSEKLLSNFTINHLRNQIYVEWK